MKHLLNYIEVNNRKKKAGGQDTDSDAGDSFHKSYIERKSCGKLILTLFEAQVGNLADGGSSPLHEDVQLVQEDLLFRVRKPVSFHHVYVGHDIFLQQYDIAYLLSSCSSRLKAQLKSTLPVWNHMPSLCRSTTRDGWGLAARARRRPCPVFSVAVPSGSPRGILTQRHKPGIH